MCTRHVNACLALALSLFFSTAHSATTGLADSGAWSVLMQGVQHDPVTDAQANKAGTEIVGDATHPSVYVNYEDDDDDKGTTEGFLGLRMTH